MLALPPDPVNAHESDGVRALRHPGSDRVGDWIQTFTGIQFWPLDPRPEEIDIRDIAHALSNQCRFAGHCNQFYSVAEHSVRVSWLLSHEYKLWGLLHDAAEAYLVDLPKPIKKWSQMGVLYSEIEDALMLAIGAKFGLTFPMPTAVKKADVVMLVTEKRDLMKMPPKPWEDTEEPDIYRVVPWQASTAERLFLELFAKLQSANAAMPQPTNDPPAERQTKRKQ